MKKTAEILGTDSPKLLTAGVFTRKDSTRPYEARIGSDSLDKGNIVYKYTIPDDVRDKINELINNIVGTAK